MLRVGVVALWACFAARSHAAYLSEALLRPVGPYPVYIELVLQPGDTSPFDLVILDGRPDAQQRVVAVFTITPSPARQVVLLHQGNWPLIDTYPQFMDGLNLSLGEQFLGVSRRLVVFNGVTGWSTGTTAPPLNQWASHPSVPGWSDALTITRNNWPAQSALSEPVLPLGSGNAFWRMHTGDTPGDFFLTAPVDSQLWLDATHRLDPGRLNEFTHLPEPSSFSVLMIAALLWVRTGSLRRAKQNGQGRT